MRNNFVAKHDHNVGSFHKDSKNDYSRDWKKELDSLLDDFIDDNPVCSTEFDTLYEKRQEISIDQYMRCDFGNIYFNN